MNEFSTLSMHSIPAEDEALRLEVRAFMREAVNNLPMHERAKSWSGYSRQLSRQMGQKGWIGVTLPKQYGGGERSVYARYVIVEEALNAGAPVGWHWIADRQSAPLILRFGSEEQKSFYIPKICKGELAFCIGMSEPGSGSDLASVRTRAQSNKQGWLLNGQKIWTTNADQCQYMIALVRTSGTPQDRHKGLSQFIVDLSLPGVNVRPIQDLSGDSHFSEVFFDDVQLPHNALIGQEGQGWEQVTAELAFERSGPERIFSSIVLFDQWLSFIRTKEGYTSEAQRTAGQVLARLAPLRAMSISLTERLHRGESPVTEAALVKDLGTTLEQDIPVLIADDLYSRRIESVPLDLLLTLDLITRIAPSFSLRGGTREILRGMIARGLGLR